MEEKAADIYSSFVVDEVAAVIKEAMEITLGGKAYSQEKVGHWTNSVIDSSLVFLTQLKKPFKYIVTCVIMQKTGVGLHVASSCFWDQATDGSCTLRWENQTMCCIVNVFGLAM